MENQKHEVRNSLQSLMDELNRSAETGDVSGVDAMLEKEQPTPQDENFGAMLDQIEMRYRRNQRRHTSRRIISRVGIACASLVLAFALTTGAAYAFRWDAFLRYFKPLTDVFSLQSYDWGEDDSSVQTQSNGTIADSEQLVISNEQQMLIEEYPACSDLLRRFFKQYRFDDVQTYHDAYVDTLYAAIAGCDAKAQVQITRSADTEILHDSLIEYSANESWSEKYSSVDVTFYKNYSCIGCCWSEKEYTVNLWGSLSQSQLLDVVSSVLGDNYEKASNQYPFGAHSGVFLHGLELCDERLHNHHASKRVL